MQPEFIERVLQMEGVGGQVDLRNAAGWSPVRMAMASHPSPVPIVKVSGTIPGSLDGYTDPFCEQVAGIGTFRWH